MNHLDFRRGACFALAFAAALMLAVPATYAADVQPFQFSDDFYRSKGIDPTMTLDHFVFPDAKFPECADDPDAPACRTRQEASPNPSRHNDVRVVETTIGWDASGNFLSYMAPSKLVPDSFMRDSSGNLTPEAQETLNLCNEFRAFLFPKTAADGSFAKSPGLPNRRQDNVFETNGGYWSNNPLGCWRLVFVVWNGSEVEGGKCQDEIADLLADNGPDLDGTPIINTLSDIEGLAKDDCVTLNTRAADGSEGFPWVI